MLESPKLPDALSAFFDAYRDAFNALDGHAVASLYAVPSGLAQDREYTHWADARPIRENMRALCELYRQRGYLQARYKAETFLQQGDDYAVADLSWQIHWAGDMPPTRFNTTYNLVRTDDGWRVLLCTAYSEKLA